MSARSVDVAIIGAGTAGLSAYRSATKAGASTLLIEGFQYGTTCARVGCMPSKLLIAAADRAHEMQTSGLFGVHAGTVHVDGKAVMARVRAERDRFVGFVIESTESIPADDRVMAQAEFIDETTLALSNGDRVNAGRVVIATGSSPFTPPPLRGAEDRLVVNDDVFEWEDLPHSVAVFGAGVIGLELGQALHRLGVHVRLFSLGGGVGPLQDPAIIDKARGTFQDEFYVDPDATVNTITRTAEGVAIEYVDYRDQSTVTETFDYVLSAAGRRPNLASLNLNQAGLTLDSKGMPEVNPTTLQCGESRIFMAGDANNQRPLLHEASDEGRIAGLNAARYPEVAPGDRRTPMTVMFSQPQIAQVGLTYQQAQDQCAGCMIIGEVSLDNQGRARVMGINKGLLRVYARQGTGQLLGAEMFGPAAEHLSHLLAWSVARGDTIETMLDMPFYHPVIEEGLRTALRDAHDQLDPDSPCGDPNFECGPGA